MKWSQKFKRTLYLVSNSPFEAHWSGDELTLTMTADRRDDVPEDILRQVRDILETPAPWLEVTKSADLQVRAEYDISDFKDSVMEDD